MPAPKKLIIGGLERITSSAYAAEAVDAVRVPIEAPRIVHGKQSTCERSMIPQWDKLPGKAGFQDTDTGKHTTDCQKQRTIDCG